jgi:cytoskeleton protein RodZ
MNEVDPPMSSAELHVDIASETGGTLLRQAREAAGLSVPAMASILKVSTAKLEALEASRWDLLPDNVFARALAFSVCRALQIDAAPVLARFPSLAAPSMKTDESGINAPFRVPGDGLGMAWLSQFRKPGTIAVLVLIAAAAALFVLPREMLKTELGVPPSGFIGTNDNSLDAVSTEVVQDSQDQVASVSDAGISVSPSSVLMPGSLPTEVAPERTAASPLPLIVEGSGAMVGTIVLKAAGASWVEVIDGRGVVQVRKTMADGEVLGASGESPLSVVVGRADVVEVEVRGKSFNTAQLTKNNIARFEVK